MTMEDSVNVKLAERSKQHAAQVAAPFLSCFCPTMLMSASQETEDRKESPFTVLHMQVSEREYTEQVYKVTGREYTEVSES